MYIYQKDKSTRDMNHIFKIITSRGKWTLNNYDNCCEFFFDNSHSSGKTS